MTLDDGMADWDAAYILGALDPEERVEYETFLSTNPAQEATVTQLADMPAILDALPRDEALAMLDIGTEPSTDDTSTVSSLADAAENRRKRSKRTRLGAAFASAAAFLLIGAIAGYAVTPDQSSPGVSLTAMAPGQRDGVTAALAVSQEGWGTRLDWQCEYTKDWATNVPSYDLVVTTKAGEQSTVGTWGPAGQRADDLSASTAIPMSDIRTVDIRVTGTMTPLTISTLS